MTEWQSQRRHSRSWPEGAESGRRCDGRSHLSIKEPPKIGSVGDVQHPLLSLQNSGDDQGLDLLLRLEESQIDRNFVDYFFSTYTLPCSKVTSDDGFLDYLPTLYRQSRKDSCLRVAVSAVAYASVLAFQDCQWMQEVVARRYAQATGLVEEALKDEIEAGKDSTLMAILLLSMFEVSDGSLP